MSGGLSFVPLGVGDAFSARWYSTCFLLEHGETRWLVDCPHPILKILRESTASCGEPVEPSTVSGVILTHLHADHCSGLESLAFYFYFALGRRLPIAAHPAVLKRLWDNHLAAGMDALLTAEGLTRKTFDDYFEAIPLSLDAPTALGSFTVECHMTRHHVPTTALRLSAGGQVWGYSADTSFDPRLIQWLCAADVVVHECNLGQHTPLDKLQALPEAQRAKLRLVHLPDWLVEEDLFIPALVQGQRVHIHSDPSSEAP
ncbi:MBL fold metallo-hydrolase [Myxococcota bacterium]|nr:MBL fold metallo-hydrolase [Myxococcota bacterium]